MIRRPKPGEGEEELLRMQEEFLREKSKDENYQPAAQVVNLRRTEPTKRPSPVEPGTRKPSKYAQSKGLKGHAEKRPRTDANNSVMGDILEKNTQKQELPEIKEEPDDDKVYFPKVLPNVLGQIVEKKLEEFQFDFSTPVPSKGFPVATKTDLSVKPLDKKSIHALEVENQAQKISQMDVDEATSSKSETVINNKPFNLPDKSYILSSKDAYDIHNENIKILGQMSETEILEEKQKLISNLDPNLVTFLKLKRKHQHQTTNDNKTNIVTLPNSSKAESMDTSESTNIETDTLWENDVLSHPHVNKWLHFDSLEKDKLEWMKGIKESKKVKDEPYEARFNFKGYLLPYTIEYTEETKTLFHHGEDPHRPGYSLAELFELSRSTVTQQRVMALNTLAGVLEYYTAGTYKDIIELPISKIFFVIRIAMDENKVIILEPALKAMRNLLYNRIDEACLDALVGFEEGTYQPCLEKDKSEIEELESNESELKDFHLAEIDLIAALLRTDILQRLYYILECVKPNFNSVQYALQILTRLVRDSAETALAVVQKDNLLETVVKTFIPVTSINFAFEPEIVYNGKPVLAAVKLLRVLSSQTREISEILITQYNILKPISEYVCSGVDGTYGLRIQIESFCILSNLMFFNVGINDIVSLCPIVATTLHKHVQGTDVNLNCSVISTTHAAVVLQLVNKLLNCHVINLDSYKHTFYPLIKEGVRKWITQLSQTNGYTCAHLRLACAVLDCCKTILYAEQLQMKFLNDSLRLLSTSRGFKNIMNNLIPSSNLLSGIENKDLHFTTNLMSLGGFVVDSTQKVLPILNVTSPLPFLASVFNVLVDVEDAEIASAFLDHISPYLSKLASKAPSLYENWFTRIESDFVFYAMRLANQCKISESKKDMIYAVASKLCYILRVDKRSQLQYLFNRIVFNKDWFTAERLMNLVSLSDGDGFSGTLASVNAIKSCYQRVINVNYKYTGPNVVLRKWQEPILPRDWIYLPILMLYSKSQEVETTPKVVGEHAKKLEAQMTAEKERIISCSLQWILFNELCFPDLLKDIHITDRFCRIMCVFLCDNSMFLDPKINAILRKCLQILFKKKAEFNFDRKLVGLHNFQDFYTQFLEQFQSVSYGDNIFAACVLVPLAQKHNVKWRKLLWSEYAGCLRALDCPEELLCYNLNEYFNPEETDESLIKSYFKALSGNLLRPGTIPHKIAEHHVKAFKLRTNK